MNCLNCGKEITGKRIKFCSNACGSTHYSQEYRKKHPDYNKNWEMKNKEKRRKQKEERSNKYNLSFEDYKYIHQWVGRHKPKPDVCQICNSKPPEELSNLSGEYKKEINDYWYLCRECHQLFDRINKTHIKPNGSEVKNETQTSLKKTN